MVNTPGAAEFYAETEAWIYQHLNTPTSLVRVEWSKGRAYSQDSAWSNQDILNHNIPQSFNHSQTNWQQAIAKLNQFDPKQVFTSYFLQQLLA